uniref:Uncharacterized protein n=1 Tax=Caenorhabditis japonica TaxID=281687 RepID=A0A8R1EBC6_CAEJA
MERDCISHNSWASCPTKWAIAPCKRQLRPCQRPCHSVGDSLVRWATRPFRGRLAPMAVGSLSARPPICIFAVLLFCPLDPNT